MNLVGKTVITSNGKGIIKLHEKDEIGRDVIRVELLNNNSSITDYFLSEVQILKNE